MFSVLAILFYLASWALLVRGVSRKERTASSIVFAAISLGIAAHIFSVYYSLHTSEGIQLGIFKISSLFFLVINTLVLLSSLKKPLHNLFLGLLPLSVTAILVSLFLSSPITKAEHLSSPLLIHILLSIIAYSLLTIASLQAILLAYQNSKLRSKHPVSIIGFLPPLQTMETLLFEIIWGGMLFLTLSIATGFFFIEDFFEQKLSHKAVFSVASWVIYAILLGGRHYLGWRGTTAIRWALGGFVALMIAYFGSKLVIEVILGAN